MQPLISPIDHESRNNSYRDDQIREDSPAENTPLLRRFPTVEQVQRNPLTTVIVTFLLVILLSGVIIGIYLLILQSRSENVLPPVDTPLQLVSRMQWDQSSVPYILASPRQANQVIVVQTNSKQCHSTTTCSNLLHSMQENTTSLPYNFLISSNGQTYEDLGWRRPSPLFPQHSATSLVLAFIGNFTEKPPTIKQLVEANNFIAESISRQYLSPSYIIFGKITKDAPKYLFKSLETLPQWSKDLSDKTK